LVCEDSWAPVGIEHCGGNVAAKYVDEPQEEPGRPFEDLWEAY
jgi:hypothetical protein